MVGVDTSLVVMDVVMAETLAEVIDRIGYLKVLALLDVLTNVQVESAVLNIELKRATADVLIYKEETGDEATEC